MQLEVQNLARLRLIGVAFRPRQVLHSDHG
jgi:hypothetical protein